MTSVLAALRRFETKPPPGLHNLEALHTVAFVFCILGMAPATFYSASIYLAPGNATSKAHLDGRFEFTPLAAETFHEPFSAMANFAYFTAGLGLFLMPCLSGDDMPAPTFAVALFLTILGGSSGAFHADASRTGTWAHVADRFAMYMPFAYLSVAVFNGLFHACLGVQAVPRSICGFLTNVGGFVFAIYTLIFQQGFNSMTFLIGTGFVIFFANGFTMLALHMRRVREEKKASNSPAPLIRTFFTAFARAGPPFFTRLLCLGIGFWFNMASADYLNTAKHCGSCPLEERIRARQLHDFTHGTWHFMTALVIMGLGLVLVEGLTGRIEPPRGYMKAAQEASTVAPMPSTKDDDEGTMVDAAAEIAQDYAKFLSRENRYEVASIAITAMLPIIFVFVHVSGAGPEVWLAVWLVIVLLGVPFGFVALVKVVGKHNHHLASIGAAKTRASEV